MQKNRGQSLSAPCFHRVGNDADTQNIAWRGVSKGCVLGVAHLTLSVGSTSVADLGVPSVWSLCAFYVPSVVSQHILNTSSTLLRP